MALLLMSVASAPGRAQAPAAAPAVEQESVRANWTLAKRFSSAALRPMIHSTAVEPHWLGKTDSLWYNWEDATGSHFYVVSPANRTKRPLFDQVKLAAALTMTSHRAADANKLPFRTVTFTKDHKAIRFTRDSVRYEWNLASETLKSLGKIDPDSVLPDEEREVDDDEGGGRRGRGRGQDRDFRNFSPDSTAFVFAKAHNLYLVNVGSPDTMQITTDGVKDYSFGSRDTSQFQVLSDSARRQARRRARDPRVRANVIWSPDSRAFAVVRTDSRKVNELYLVNVLAKPRPALMSYRYAMPGEPRDHDRGGARASGSSG